jgi:hypothetical protein
LLETRIVSRVRPAAKTPAQVEREFRGLLADGARLRACGSARRSPGRLLTWGYAPKHAVRLFDATFYLTHLRLGDELRFFVGYVLLGADRDPARGEIHPRIFYKDSSLVWRSPTHFIRSARENWIGKGALKCVREDGAWLEYGAEETTNLPLEIQPALDELSRRGPPPRRDPRALGRILRRAPDGRFEPYQDFSAPRARAASDPRNRIHGGEPIAWFTRRGDPGSLRFARGYDPDFGGGLLEVTRSASRLYGGRVGKYRILSKNRRIQYQFVAGPRHVWIIPPQALTTELSSYGVRTIDVEADDDLFVPGYEYHFVDESVSPPQLHSQIPDGFAGAASTVDPSRADASGWLEALPVIREFRRRLRLPPRRKPRAHST